MIPRVTHIHRMIGKTFFSRVFVSVLRALVLVGLFWQPNIADNLKSYITNKKENGCFTLSTLGKSAPLCVSSKDYPVVGRILRQLQTDIGRVTNALPLISTDTIPLVSEIVLVGTIGRSPFINELVKTKKLDIEGIAGHWETFLIQVVEEPFPGVSRALVIAGSDKRGTIYGMYDISSQIGVSPWYWWADVPVKRSSEIYVLPGRHTKGEPKVKYRGIFINDESPALSGWVEKNFGGFNAKFYEHVFELILRLTGNFLWPAMWGRAFYDDDPENPRLADEYGVVIGTSHHEPMMRAHDEWRRYGKGGPWNYEKNDSSLRQFWREGIKRMGTYESIVTLAMRGNGDEPMSADANVALLERIVADQRRILGEISGRDVTSIPQVWALYKEVQEYYDRGMRVPDDVTVLLCDDNWGNIRKLPKHTDPHRTGGYGLYYHFDFVGGPRNYKWLNTTQIERVWEQMHLAYDYGVRQIWIVNVGDIKPMEFPINFFLDYAWDPEAISAADLPNYYRRWAADQFCPQHADDIADILMKYTKFNSRRKPELLDSTTYSLTSYREAETVVDEYNTVAGKAQRIYDDLLPEYKDAFYQLVLHQPIASATLNELLFMVGKNHLYANQGRAETNSLARRARELFVKDSLITYYYNNVLANGKWSHMMDQTHIGYTSWQQPEINVMPSVNEIKLPESAEMGVAIEGSLNWWPNKNIEPVLPIFDRYNRQRFYIDVFNRGQTPFQFSIRPSELWIHIDRTSRKVTTTHRLWVSVDWERAPSGNHRVPITINGPGRRRVVAYAIINNPPTPQPNQFNGFVENDGYVSMEATNFTREVTLPGVSWLKIPNLGRTGSAVTASPVTTAPQTPGGVSPRLEYEMYLFTSGDVRVMTYLSPVLNFHSDEGLRYAISFDDDPPQIVHISETDTILDWKYPGWWNESVSNNIRILTTKHVIKNPGAHVLKFWLVDAGVVLQKLVVGTGEVKASYLGPPESYHQ